MSCLALIWLNLAHDKKIGKAHTLVIVKVECLAEGPNPAESLKRPVYRYRREIE
jgi:hypothetical protein